MLKIQTSWAVLLVVRVLYNFFSLFFQKFPLIQSHAAQTRRSCSVPKCLILFIASDRVKHLKRHVKLILISVLLLRTKICHSCTCFKYCYILKDL